MPCAEPRKRRNFHAPSPDFGGDTAAAHRHHRRRHGRHPRRDQAARSRLSGFHDLREGGAPRRHLAREHLPWNRLRRARASLHLLLRTEPGLEPCVRAGRRDPALFRARRRQVRGHPGHPLRRGDHPLRVHRRPLATAHEGRRDRRRRCRHRGDRRAASPEHPRTRGTGGFQGRLLPQRALGSCRAARRATCRRHRHRLHRHPDHLGAGAAGVEVHSVPAHCAVDHADREPGVHGRAARGLRPRSAAHRKTARGNPSRGNREDLKCRRRRRFAADALDRGHVPQQPRAQRARPGPARAAAP